MRNERVLISGASVAGPALAYWLKRYGFRVTVVERAPELRPGGQAIDVRGPALEVLKRMDLLPEVRARATDLRGISMVDGEGRELFSTTEATASGGRLDRPDVEILRDDLAELLVRAGGPDIEYLFGDSIENLEEDGASGVGGATGAGEAGRSRSGADGAADGADGGGGANGGANGADDGGANGADGGGGEAAGVGGAAGVRVRFESGRERTFDLVVGADGIHSRTRALAFGPEERYIRPLGGHLSVWTAPNYLGLDRWQIAHQPESGPWQALVMSVRGNTEARVYVVIEDDSLLQSEPGETQLRDPEAQKKLIARYCADARWEMPRLLSYMWEAPDFHFDSVAQIHMDSWSRGRVALVGDAGHCGSPASGQGTSMALLGAYTLAGELHAAGGDHVAAFAAYERELRAYVTANQALAHTLREAARRSAGAAADFPAGGEATASAGTRTRVPDYGDDFYDVIDGYTPRDY
ncbi:FAD-dependent monooxygenase [Streptomyces iconiensis]|uniref:FAD-dependent monooxygenase n=1 Tax=Streptomyces iconiensis TaxID=1384038 RepID=A0ABT7A7W8_9ACTN|nr:FAD-dependent monooxygenase [Streptomyces iconiensis]MDJ1137435.1 FAD-dependent monooxygenase [Streptomyces iconiensis]